MKKILASILSICFTFFLWYTSLWIDPEKSDLLEYSIEGNYQFIRKSDNTPILENEIRTTWEKYQDKKLASNLVYPFNINSDIRALYRHSIWKCRNKICMYLFFLVIFSQIVVAFIPSYRRRKRFFRDTLDQLINDKFNNDREKTRVTIYKQKRGVFFIFLYIKALLNPESIKAHYRSNLTRYHLRKIPLPWKKYLIPIERRGLPYEEPISSTYFEIASSEQTLNGIVSYVWMTGNTYCKRLPNILTSDLRQYDNIEEITDINLRNNVEDYMNKGKIRDFEKLKSMHRLSRNIWATVIVNETADKSAVIVIDNDEHRIPFNDPLIEETLIQYCRIIERSLIVFSNVQ